MVKTNERGVTLDASQRRVLELHPNGHARVIGAPGSGKTGLIVRTMSRLLEQERWDPQRVLVLSHNRAVGTRMRDLIERELTIPLTGRLVRTPASFAYAVIAHARLNGDGLPPPELITGSRQDQLLGSIVESDDFWMNVDGWDVETLPREVIKSERYRTELRDLWRVLDEADMDPETLTGITERLRDGQVRASGLSHEQQRAISTNWRMASALLHQAREHLVNETGGVWTSSGIIREAVRILRSQDASLDGFEIPELIIIDNAQDLTEGALRLVSSCVDRGARVWCFGDPDVATASFQSYPTDVLRDLTGELRRTGARIPAGKEQEQCVILQHVYRHGGHIRSVVQELSERIGTGQGWKHRSASPLATNLAEVTVTRVQNAVQQVGTIAHRLRREYLGVGPRAERTSWSDMAVVCRTGDEVRSMARLLESHEVPTVVDGGGIVPGQFAIARHLVSLLLTAMAQESPDANTILDWMTGPFGGLDAVALRRLSHACLLTERNLAFQEGRQPRKWKDLVLAVFQDPEGLPDSAEGRRVRRLMDTYRAGSVLAELGNRSPREILWAIWDASRLATVLKQRALSQTGLESSLANDELDAVMEVFFALQRHEERASDTPVQDLLMELLEGAIAQDTLANRSVRPAVTVTTPQGAVGREFEVVVIAGPQDGLWPNLKPRGSLVGSRLLEVLLRTGDIHVQRRADTLHDELRMFTQACSRARQQLLVVARDDEDEVPSLFYHLLEQHETLDLPNTSLTLRGHVASLRRRLLVDPEDADAARELSLLAKEGVDGADPSTWYGMREPTTDTPTMDHASQTGSADAKKQPLRIAPSAIDTIEECPLNWVLQSLGASTTNSSASIGTLLHHLLEIGGDEPQWQRIVSEQWDEIDFEAPWDEQRWSDQVQRMLRGLADYVDASDRVGHTTVAAEASFTVSLGRIELSGRIDRVELRMTDSGLKPVVVDLKTGTQVPVIAKLDEHPQLLAYQLGMQEGTVTNSDGTVVDTGTTEPGGAVLLYVSPKAQKTNETFREFTQEPLNDQMRASFIERLERVAEMMESGTFTANIEHHCTQSQRPALCAIHVVPAVSFE